MGWGFLFCQEDTIPRRPFLVLVPPHKHQIVYVIPSTENTLIAPYLFHKVAQIILLYHVALHLMKPSRGSVYSCAHSCTYLEQEGYLGVVSIWLLQLPEILQHQPIVAVILSNPCLVVQIPAVAASSDGTRVGGELEFDGWQISVAARAVIYVLAELRWILRYLFKRGDSMFDLRLSKFEWDSTEISPPLAASPPPDWMLAFWCIVRRESISFSSSRPGLSPWHLASGDLPLGLWAQWSLVSVCSRVPAAYDLS